MNTAIKNNIERILRQVDRFGYVNEEDLPFIANQLRQRLQIEVISALRCTSCGVDCDLLEVKDSEGATFTICRDCLNKIENGDDDGGDDE